MRVRFVRLLAATTSAAVVVATLLPQVSGGTTADSRNSVDGQSAADSQGNLHVPKDYRSAYEYLGSWAIADEKGQVQSRSIWSMHRPGLSPPTGRTHASLTAPCW